MRTRFDDYLSTVQNALAQIDRAEVEAFVSVLFEAFLEQRCIFAVGNGASAALASHMACDLGKGTAVDLGRGPQAGAMPRLRIISLNDNAALMTAYSNDLCYDDVFVEQLKNLLRPDDVVVGISGSGGSANVLRAMNYARDHGARTVGLTGSQPSARQLAEFCDLCLMMPLEQIEQIEDLHVIVHHMVSVGLRERIAEHLLLRPLARRANPSMAVPLASEIAAND